MSGQPHVLATLSPQYSLDKRLSGPQKWSEHGGEEKRTPHLPLLRINPWSFSI